MRGALMLLLVAGCGRVAFDGHDGHDGGIRDASPAGEDARTPPTATARTISAGGHRSCALQNGDIYCWGRGDTGGLGDGSTNLRATPGPVPAVATFVAVESGDGGTCGLVADGTVWCWGVNVWGQLGLGHDAIVQMPEQVPVSDIAQLAIGNEGSCLRRVTGEVLCAGRGDLIGDGLGTARDVFTLVPGITDAIDLTAGDEHICALHATGAVSCWGENSFGQLGDGSMLTRTSPVAGPVGPYDDIAAGDYTTCARRGGEVDCWGKGDVGELGDGRGQDSTSAVAVLGITDAVSLAVGAGFGCVLRATRTATCWGEGVEGAHGDGLMANRLQPGADAQLTDIEELSSRTGAHVCARTGNGDVYCWGHNVYGQIGDGTSGTFVYLPRRALVP